MAAGVFAKYKHRSRFLLRLFSPHQFHSTLFIQIPSHAFVNVRGLAMAVAQQVIPQLQQQMPMGGNLLGHAFGLGRSVADNCKGLHIRATKHLRDFAPQKQNPFDYLLDERWVSKPERNMMCQYASYDALAAYRAGAELQALKPNSSVAQRFGAYIPSLFPPPPSTPPPGPTSLAGLEVASSDDEDDL